jgi:hypothetical protein
VRQANFLFLTELQYEKWKLACRTCISVIFVNIPTDFARANHEKTRRWKLLGRETKEIGLQSVLSVLCCFL